MTSRYEAAAFLRRDLRQQADYFANPSIERTAFGSLSSQTLFRKLPF